MKGGSFRRFKPDLGDFSVKKQISSAIVRKLLSLVGEKFSWEQVSREPDNYFNLGWADEFRWRLSWRQQQLELFDLTVVVVVQFGRFVNKKKERGKKNNIL